MDQLGVNSAKEITHMSSGHWIKILKGTPNKPAMAEIRRWCECTKAEAFLAFFELYSYFDDVTADGFIPFFRKEDADERGGLSDLGNALEAIGWITFHPEGARVIDWEKHNGKSAKKRLLDSERQNRCRGKGKVV
jgi:hypothetical protein